MPAQFSGASSKKSMLRRHRRLQFGQQFPAKPRPAQWACDGSSGILAARRRRRDPEVRSGCAPPVADLLLRRRSWRVALLVAPRLPSLCRRRPSCLLHPSCRRRISLRRTCRRSSCRPARVDNRPAVLRRQTDVSGVGNRPTWRRHDGTGGRKRGSAFHNFLRGGWVKASAMGRLRGLVGAEAILLHPGRMFRRCPA